ncbi:hypothetical protein CS062_09430, partial [Roseateles chitinivorans]
LLDRLPLPTARLRTLRRAADAAQRFDFDGALVLVRADASGRRGLATEADTDPTSSGSPA